MINDKLTKELQEQITENKNNINNMQPTILFENSSGTSDSISISTINDYKYIDVSYKCNDFHNTKRIYKSEYNKRNNLISIYTEGGVFIIYCNNWKFIETTFSRNSGYYLYMTSSGVNELNINSDNIKITKIVGYK